MIAYSREVGPMLGFIAMVYAIYLLGGDIYQGLFEQFHYTFSHLSAWQYGEMPFYTRIFPLLDSITVSMLILFAVAFLGPFIGHGLQKGFDAKWEASKPKLDKLNPSEGIKNLFSVDAIINFVKNLIKTIGFMYIFYLTIEPYIDRIIYLAAVPFEDALRLTGVIFVKFLVYATLFLVVLAVSDYYVNWRRTHAQLMMSRHELKEEMKDSEGNPQIKGKVRQIQQERAKRQLKKQVPAATVIVTNPTHFAVALKYEKGKVPVPKVVAKGADEMAKRIRELAKESGVPIVENPPLARALYREVKVGREIPYKFYKTVAKLIAAILRLEEEKKLKRRRAYPGGGEAPSALR